MNRLSLVPSLLHHSRAPRETLLRFQDRQIRRVIRHAYANVPYYRRLFDFAGVRPEHIRTSADMYRIPITTKNDLRGLPPEDVVARGVDPQKLISHTTGGSSGEPFVVRRSWMEERILGVPRIRTLLYYGLRRHDVVALLIFNHKSNPNDYQLPQRLMQKIHRVKAQWIHCLVPPEEMLEQLAAIQPDVLGGYAGVLSRLSQLVKEPGRPSIRPRMVLTGGETLTPFMSRQISEAFNAPVYDTYGSHEFSRTAWQCKETGEYHVCDDAVLLEVLRDDQPVAIGERGEVVGTALHSFAMPFIRYRLGDIVTRGKESCACGQPFSTLREIQGRMVDYFPLPDGRLLHPYEIASALQNSAMRWVGQYRIVQERKDCIVLLAVPAIAPTVEQLSELEALAGKVLGPTVRFHVRLVDGLELGKRGKFRVYQSLVHSAYDNPGEPVAEGELAESTSGGSSELR